MTGSQVLAIGGGALIVGTAIGCALALLEDHTITRRLLAGLAYRRRWRQVRALDIDMSGSHGRVHIDVHPARGRCLSIEVGTDQLDMLGAMITGELLDQRRAQAECVAHGRTACEACSRNPSTCVDGYGECSVYARTGMHWDTCANRIRG